MAIETKSCDRIFGLESGAISNYRQQKLKGLILPKHSYLCPTPYSLLPTPYSLLPFQVLNPITKSAIAFF
ncbi:MAG: hypothetical protein F6K26_34140 [Moorea sp. SIO2I5]|nr:hypothetical protein [Moorena sp. SIO2I5]